MPDVQDANERFNRLWDEIGAKRVALGDSLTGRTGRSVREPGGAAPPPASDATR